MTLAAILFAIVIVMNLIISSQIADTETISNTSDVKSVKLERDGIRWKGAVKVRNTVLQTQGLTFTDTLKACSKAAETELKRLLNGADTKSVYNGKQEDKPKSDNSKGSNGNGVSSKHKKEDSAKSDSSESMEPKRG